MQTIGAFEAKTHLSALLDRVANGERITITKRGTAVAMLVPMDSSTKRDQSEVVEALLEFGQGRSLKGESIRDLIESGRRF